MASQEDESMSVSAKSLANPRDMQKELDQWRQQRSVRQARAKENKENTVEKTSGAVPRKTFRGGGAALSLRCCSNVDRGPVSSQERDMRKELECWKARRQTRGKENLPFQATTPRSTVDVRESPRLREARDVGCSSRSSGSRAPRQGCAVTTAIAALQTSIPLAPPPSPTHSDRADLRSLGAIDSRVLVPELCFSCATDCKSRGACGGVTALEPHALHAAVLAAFEVRRKLSIPFAWHHMPAVVLEVR